MAIRLKRIYAVRDGDTVLGEFPTMKQALAFQRSFRGRNALVSEFMAYRGYQISPPVADADDLDLPGIDIGAFDRRFREVCRGIEPFDERIPALAEVFTGISRSEMSGAINEYCVFRQAAIGSGREAAAFVLTLDEFTGGSILRRFGNA